MGYLSNILSYFNRSNQPSGAKSCNLRQDFFPRSLPSLRLDLDLVIFLLPAINLGDRHANG